MAKEKEIRADLKGTYPGLVIFLKIVAAFVGIWIAMGWLEGGNLKNPQVYVPPSPPKGELVQDPSITHITKDWLVIPIGRNVCDIQWWPLTPNVDYLVATNGNTSTARTLRLGERWPLTGQNISSIMFCIKPGQKVHEIGFRFESAVRKEE